MSSASDKTFDPELHMHRVTDPPSPDMRRLSFLRHVAERDDSDGPVQGDSSGPLTDDYTPPDPSLRPPWHGRGA